MMDRSEFKSVSVLAHDYSAYDLADHIADVIETLSDGQSIWTLSAMELALLASDYYPGGAIGLQLALM
jgi:hypothetical protein